jgi:protein TonB
MEVTGQENIIASKDSITSGEALYFAEVEEPPLFNGKHPDEGEFYNFVRKNLNYPNFEMEFPLSGRVIVEFIIDKDGAVTNAKVIRGIDPWADAEALRVINSSPKWTPGKHCGEPVKVRFLFPVMFRIDN